MPEQKKKKKKPTNRQCSAFTFFRTKNIMHCKTGFAIHIAQGLKEKTQFIQYLEDLLLVK